MIYCFFFSTRSKEIDWQPYFTTRIVDDFGTHLRVFRKAQQRVTEKDDQVKGTDFISFESQDLKISYFFVYSQLFLVVLGTAEDLVETFFEVEVEMEKDVCRDLVCTSPKDEEGFTFTITFLSPVTG